MQASCPSSWLPAYIKTVWKIILKSDVMFESNRQHFHCHHNKACKILLDMKFWITNIKKMLPSPKFHDWFSTCTPSTHLSHGLCDPHHSGHSHIQSKSFLCSPLCAFPIFVCHLFPTSLLFTFELRHSWRGAPIILLYMYSDNKGPFYSFLFCSSVLFPLRFLKFAHWMTVVQMKAQRGSGLLHIRPWHQTHLYSLVLISGWTLSAFVLFLLRFSLLLFCFILVILEVQDFGPNKLILSDDPQTVNQLTPIFRGAHVAT